MILCKHKQLIETYRTRPSALDTGLAKAWVAKSISGLAGRERSAFATRRAAVLGGCFFLRPLLHRSCLGPVGDGERDLAASFNAGSTSESNLRFQAQTTSHINDMGASVFREDVAACEKETR